MQVAQIILTVAVAGFIAALAAFLAAAALVLAKVGDATQEID